jgi:hypothetical protein
MPVINLEMFLPIARIPVPKFRKNVFFHIVAEKIDEDSRLALDRLKRALYLSVTKIIVSLWERLGRLGSSKRIRSTSHFSSLLLTEGEKS